MYTFNMIEPILRKWSCIRLLHNKKSLETIANNPAYYEILNENAIDKAIKDVAVSEPPSVLEKCEEDISHVAPYLKPTFNFAAYVNRSESLQNLLKLGVNLYKLEQMEDVPAFIMGLDFEKSMKAHIMFLYDLGLQIDDVGKFITQNPMIFKENLDDLTTRINYLKYKLFDNEMIVRIVTVNPNWLNFSTQAIDNRLGFFQHTFSLTGDEVRALCVKKPKIVTYSLSHIKVNTFALKEEMGFTREEMKLVLLRKPEVFIHSQHRILKSFEYVHKTMQISLEDIVKWPGILTCRVHKLKERYGFLQLLDRVQFDPKKPNYVSFQALVSGTDSQFASEVAKSSVQAYNEYLKTL